MTHEVFQRYAGNPILTADMWPHPVTSVFNPGATLDRDGETVLLARAENMRGCSRLYEVRSSDGFTDWQINPEPLLTPGVPAQEEYGAEDARVTWVPELGEYVVAYAAHGGQGAHVALAVTEEQSFQKLKRTCYLYPHGNKDAALFPRRIGGKWWLINRPSTGSIWISASADMQGWDEHHEIIKPRGGPFWDGTHVGLSPTPMETPWGWLIMYHGCKMTSAGPIYRNGLAMLALEDPTRIVRKTDGYVFGPRELYERIGDIPNVVFPCGWTVVGDEVRLYYGAADTCIGVATVTMADLALAMRER